MDLQNDPFANRVMECFPDCFTDEDTSGRIPLSIVMAYAQIKIWLQSKVIAPDRICPCSYDVQNDIDIPVIEFATGPEGNEKALPLPRDIDLSQAVQGAVIDYRGQDFVVLENNDETDSLYLASTGRVDPNS